ncbi:unnamed protein product [Meloidogyne enterolobii]|uniref:Uncharacterized protein n=1 Tax=Meloidogyne enterolobii TaxID=390850 RepID=A0ACB0ZUS1_MELEN
MGILLIFGLFILAFFGFSIPIRVGVFESGRRSSHFSRALFLSVRPDRVKFFDKIRCPTRSFGSGPPTLIPMFFHFHLLENIVGYEDTCGLFQTSFCGQIK